MKKLFLISVVGFVLIGCSENGKITKEFLNGDWMCKQKIFQENELDIDYKEPYKTERQKRIFKFDGDDLYSYSSKTGEKENLIKVDSMNDYFSEDEYSDHGKTTIIDQFKKNNDDKWTWIHEEIFTSKQVDLDDHKRKYETICTRIK